jgi:protein-ribulosamine 3-kinase
MFAAKCRFFFSTINRDEMNATIPFILRGLVQAEFGMSWCAGFSGEFWRGYHSVIPKEPGFEDRHQIYQLYHLLNHYNLFGYSYYSQCEQILQRLTRKL